MSNNIANHFGSKYSNRVRHFYQQMFARLHHTVDSREKITDAKDLTFWRMGKSTSADRPYGGVLTAQNQDMPSVTLAPYETSSLNWLDRQNFKRINYNATDAFAKSQAAELARKTDKRIIDAAYAGAALNTAVNGGVPFDFTGAQAKLEHLMKIRSVMGEYDIPGSDLVTVLISPTVFDALCLFPAFNSSDWIKMDNRTLDSSSRIYGKNWNGMNIIAHTGLTNTGFATAADTVNCVAYHKPAIGYAAFDEITTTTADTLSNDKPGLNIYSFIDSDAKAIDPVGCVAFNMQNFYAA